MNDPNQLKAMQNDRENVLTTIIPFLRSVSTVESIPKISIYQGMDEVKNIYLDTLIGTKSICSLASSERMEKHFGADWIQSYIKKRLAANVQSRFIATDHMASNFYKNRDESELRETKILPKKFDLALDIEIYKNKVLLMSASENPFAVLIEDDKVSKSLKNIFEFMWSAL